MNASGKTGDQRFQDGAQKYAGYLETFEGRLRSDLAFANLENFIPANNRDSLSALDIGGGTGNTAVRLAQLGIHTTVLDSSSAMLQMAEKTAEATGLSHKVTQKLGDAKNVVGSFDLILCHNLLEYVDDCEAVLHAAARALRDSSAVLSLLVRNRNGEVLKAAIQDGNLDAARKSLSAEFGRESLFGGRVRLFTPDNLGCMLKTASLELIAERGVRIVADYLPPSVSRAEMYEQVLKLELELGKRQEFAAIARYTQCFARRAHPTKDGSR